MKSRKIKWEGHVDLLGEKRNAQAADFWWENLQEDLGVYEKMILKWILKEKDGRVWSEFFLLRRAPNGRVMLIW